MASQYYISQCRDRLALVFEYGFLGKCAPLVIMVLKFSRNWLELRVWDGTYQKMIKLLPDKTCDKTKSNKIH